MEVECLVLARRARRRAVSLELVQPWLFLPCGAAFVLGLPCGGCLIVFLPLVG